MKITNKIHRGASLAAAIVMLIILILGTGSNVITTVTNIHRYENTQLLTTILNLVINTVSSILLIVVLFRGKKDTLAAVFFLVTALPILVRGLVGNITTVFAYLAMRHFDGNMAALGVAATVILFLANLISIVFRVLLAAECFKPGKISGGGAKILLLILPIANILLTAVSTMVRQLYMVFDYGYELGVYFSATLIPAVITAVFSIGIVIMGLAFSIPVYEKKPYAFEAETGYNFN